MKKLRYLRIVEILHFVQDDRKSGTTSAQQQNREIAFGNSYRFQESIGDASRKD
jgi:hypothetical protein